MLQINLFSLELAEINFDLVVLKSTSDKSCCDLLALGIIKCIPPWSGGLLQQGHLSRAVGRTAFSCVSDLLLGSVCSSLC